MKIQKEEFKGNFFKECPCSPEAVSCGYYNINLHTGCPYSCSYCILQTYLETKDPVFFTNYEKAVSELNEAQKHLKYLRVSTGELSDSLAYDRETNFSDQIFSVMKKFPDIVFEFKTKSANVDNLLKRAPKKNIVVSWSLNPEQIIKREEPGTASLKERLIAMERVQDHGYKISIHFDPLILAEGWKGLYRELIEKIGGIVKSESIAWWSLGALRFPESLKHHIFKHKNSRLFYGELIKGYDNKYRYFKPLRRELFRFVR
ncbi:MAG: spore photoproduct lyase family protein, partial [Acidobacteriota bacterium]